MKLFHRVRNSFNSQDSTPLREGTSFSYKVRNARQNVVTFSKTHLPTVAATVAIIATAALAVLCILHFSKIALPWQAWTGFGAVAGGCALTIALFILGNRIGQGDFFVRRSAKELNSYNNKATFDASPSYGPGELEGPAQ